ncbi:NIPSNAP family protein [Sphingobacterium daejeonense]|uniref:NIPSNAP family protein n=1 Tax=Sphingobacterium daejeonense TaxID=371142 RepID=UPI0021A59EBF|nr:NIPSNAP family protein [Sphingobacterium daejeonense]MCT1530503.1 NIPSNAP family protein [Sphingobacterium daejeonense]
MLKISYSPLRILILFLFFFCVSTSYSISKSAYFQLKVYHFKSLDQEHSIDQYLEKAYLPAMHKLGFKHIAVFKPIENKNNEDKIIYVFTSANDLEKFVHLEKNLLKNKQYLEAGKSYLDASHSNPPFTRVETIWMQAFEGMPFMDIPKLKSNKNERVYELRSYEGPTEKLSLNKISMFNDGEIDIFKKLNFNAVFYGKVIAGSTMPNLIYLTTFENMKDRDEHWKAFGPLYKPMAEMPKYQNNVSKNVTILCTPADYSDI